MRRSEAAALLDLEDCTAEEAALGLGPHCDIAVVTDGANGSCVSALGSLHVRAMPWSLPGSLCQRPRPAMAELGAAAQFQGVCVATLSLATSRTDLQGFGEALKH